MKRVFDFVIAFSLLFLFSPIIILLGFILLVIDGPPILFRQKRLGRDEKVFTIVKFRTLPNGWPSEGGVSWYGRFLRKTHADEILNLWNVVAGDMSLVGPRPLLVDYAEHMPKRFKGRSKVKPGITGLAQVSGGTRISWNDKMLYDIVYVRRVCWKLDFWILFATLNVILKDATCKDAVHMNFNIYE